MQPSEETVSAFNAFASANNLQATIISPNQDWVSITLPVSKANSLFAAQFQTFKHADMSAPITRTLTLSLPSNLVGHVDVVHPTTDFTGPDVRLAPSRRKLNIAPKQRAVVERAVSPSCNSNVSTGVITPTCLQVSNIEYIAHANLIILLLYRSCMVYLLPQPPRRATPC